MCDRLGQPIGNSSDSRSNQTDKILIQCHYSNIGSNRDNDIESKEPTGKTNYKKVQDLIFKI